MIRTVMRSQIVLVLIMLIPQWTSAEDRIAAFLKSNCYDCHTQDTKEGGLDLTSLTIDFSDVGLHDKWELLFDRVSQNEMPPKDADRPAVEEKQAFLKLLEDSLRSAHERRKGTVLRRLNRREYHNTLNDLFGTELSLEERLPEDGRSHEFDNVGEALGLSMVHLQKYLETAGLVLDEAIAKTTEKPQPVTIKASYGETREAEQFVGKVWKKLPDGAIVRFAGGGYPSGMMRGSGVRTAGRYRVQVTGYAYQSKEPIIASIGGTSFRAGSEKPIYGYFTFPPGKPTTIELETYIDSNYMIAIEPYGISDPERYKRKSIDEYKGPGLAILSVVLTGPQMREFPGKGHRLIYDGLNRKEIMPRNPNDRKKSWYQPKFEVICENETLDATRSIQRVCTAAFRRPVTKEDQEPYLKLFQQERTKGSTFEEALRSSVVAIFCSPKFLYLQEPQGLLDDSALASRLSYFLTRTAPDDELLKVAAAGKLTETQTLLAQASRLMKHPRFDRFITDFTEAWLNLRDMDFTAPDPQLFPEYDLYLRYSMPLETKAYLKELISSNLSVTHLVDADFAMLNSRLAELYQLPPVTGTAIRKVKLPPNSLRGGFLSQASILKVSANGTNTSPVIRGVWVMERILGEVPPPPPAGVPGVEPDIRGAETLREILDQHRSVQTCNSCHRKIDPPGFAMESFNPIGGYRDYYRSLGKGERLPILVKGRNVRYRKGPDVDCSGHLPDGTAFSNFKEFKKLLTKDSDVLTRNFLRKLLTFATGRELGFSDREEIERMVREASKNNYGIHDLFLAVITSKIFREK